MFEHALISGANSYLGNVFKSWLEQNITTKSESKQLA